MLQTQLPVTAGKGFGADILVLGVRGWSVPVGMISYEAECRVVAAENRGNVVVGLPR